MRAIIRACCAACMCFVAVNALASGCELQKMPWSGYWWPTLIGGLANGGDYDGMPSPLAKYDKVVYGYYPGPATNFGASRYYRPDGKSWGGMCFNVAAAAIMEAEPTSRGIYNGVIFNVGDKKGLLTAAYDSALYVRYPIASPVDFHELMYRFLCEERTSVIIDIGCGEEIWTYPVFKFESSSQRAGSRIHYETRIDYASSEVTPDFTGTKRSMAVYNYYFDLAEDGTTVIGSGWEYGSGSCPPKDVYEIFGPDPVNDSLDYETVKKIVASVDDSFEENDSFDAAVQIGPGTNTMLAIDDDFFKLSIRTGDQLTVIIDSESENGLATEIYDINRLKIGTINGSGIYSFDALKTGDYFVRVRPLNMGDEIIYSISIMLKLPYTYYFPVNPPGLWSEGVGFLNDEGELDRVIMTLVDRSGAVKKSHAIEKSSGAFQRRGSLETDFNLTQMEDGYVRIDSDTPLQGFMAVTDGNSRSFGMNALSKDAASSAIYFPHIAKTDGWKTTFGIINVSASSITIVRQPFDEQGFNLPSDSLKLNAGQKMEFQTPTSLLPSAARSLSIAVAGGKAAIIGYMKCILPWVMPRGEAFIALSSNGYREKLIVPHVASNDEWKTGMALMNVGESATIGNIDAYDASGAFIARVPVELAPKQNFAAEISTIFTGVLPEIIASLKIASTGGSPLCGFIKYISTDGYQLEGMQIKGPDGSKLRLPLVAETDSWNTGIAVMNAGAVPDNIVLKLFDSEGSEICSRERTLNPNARMAETTDALFDGCLLDGPSYMTAESSLGNPLSGLFLMNSDECRWLLGDSLQ
ncbi:MAG: hypothetical protein JW884_14715 [Deltaproteobacteria bacterium]|nr:hypothetical protein [Deltaproteobacteria bacterium]